MRKKNILISSVVLFILLGFYLYTQDYRLSPDTILSDFYDYYPDIEPTNTVKLDSKRTAYNFKDSNVGVIIKRDFFIYKPLEVSDINTTDDYTLWSYIENNFSVYSLKLNSGVSMKPYQIKYSDNSRVDFEILQWDENKEGVYSGKTYYSGFNVFLRNNEIVDVLVGIPGRKDYGSTIRNQTIISYQFENKKGSFELNEEWNDIIDYKYGESYSDLDTKTCKYLGFISIKNEYDETINYYDCDNYVVVKSFEHDQTETESVYLMHPFHFTRIESFIENMN